MDHTMILHENQEEFIAQLMERIVIQYRERQDFLALLKGTHIYEDYLIQQKQQIATLCDYFDFKAVKTIVKEENYIDKYYKEDHSNSYIKCHKSYSEYCVRLHFFIESFTGADFLEYLNGKKNKLNDSVLQDAYIGYVVLRPLPETIIGRTCLEPPRDKKREFGLKAKKVDKNLEEDFYLKVEYKTKPFGIPLKIESLLFQEQDYAVSTCAIMALWFAFQKTSDLYKSYLPSPVDIKKAATQHFFPIRSNRSIPDSGLIVGEMAVAVQKFELNPFCSNPSDHNKLKNIVYAFLKGGVPLIWVLRLYDISKEDEPECKGLHTVAITGFSLLNATDITVDGDTELLLTSSRINKLYVHDDQVGPYVEIGFDTGKIKAYEDKITKRKYDTIEYPLTTQLKSKDGNKSIRAESVDLIAPLLPAINIQYNKIRGLICAFNNHVGYLRKNKNNYYNKNKPFPWPEQFEWDMHITLAENIKDEILHSRMEASGVKNKANRYDNIEDRIEVLTMSLPFVLWRVVAYHKEKPIIEFWFDAIDIEQGSILTYIIPYDITFASLICASVSKLDTEKHGDVWLKECWQILQWLKKNMEFYD